MQQNVLHAWRLAASLPRRVIFVQHVNFKQMRDRNCEQLYTSAVTSAPFKESSAQCRAFEDCPNIKVAWKATKVTKQRFMICGFAMPEAQSLVLSQY